MKLLAMNLKSTLTLWVGVLFLLIASLAHAQESTDGSIFKPFVSAGLSSSQISGDQLQGFKQLGFNAGLGAEIKLSQRWNPSIEIQFDQRGSRKNAKPDEGDYESYLLRLNYVQVPICLGYTSGGVGFEIGAAPAFLISYREENQIGDVVGLGRDFNSFELSGLAGIRYDFAERWTLATRLLQSISPVRDHAGAASFRLNRGQYSTAIQFMLRFHV